MNGRGVLPLKHREWFHQIGGEGEFAFVDSGGDLLRALVGHAEHFKFGIEVVDVVEGKRFRGAGEGRRSELELAVVGGDEVEEVEAEDKDGSVEMAA